jgi:Protease inhibitor Inh
LDLLGGRIIGLASMRGAKRGAAATAAAIVLVALAACTTHSPAEPPPAESAAPPPPPPLPAPPPIDLSGKWQLSAAGGPSCAMTFGANPGAVQGSIAPAGGCPGNFFTSRKWTFENGALIIHDFKGAPLAQLSLSTDHFEGQATNGMALTLSR